VQVKEVMPLALLTACVMLQDAGVEGRYRLSAPLPSLPAVMLDSLGNGMGIAQQTARANGLQARILWVDGTANLNKVGTEAGVRKLVNQAADIGFNTIIFDVKPIVGYTLYPSELTQQLTAWRDQQLPPGFDPLAAMVTVCKERNIALFASMNVWSEGHRLSRTGPGFALRERQTVQYDAEPIVRSAASKDQSFPLLRTWSLSGYLETNIYSFPFLPFWKLLPDAYACIVDKTGRVLSTHAQGQTNDWIPPGGACFYATGRAAKWLSTYGQKGMRLAISSVPKLRPIEDNLTQWPLMMNPLLPENQERALSFVKEVLTKYPIQGIVFDDRLRFGGLNADFSSATHRALESVVGKSVRWPEDVYTVTFLPDLTQGIRPGKWFDAWLNLRAHTLKEWVKKARVTIDNVLPGSKLGVYAGSWYGEYPMLGNNYASPKLRAGFAFLTDSYRETGFADALDFLMTGCYYKVGTIVEAMERGAPTGPTVEAAGQLSNRLAREQCWTVAGIKLDEYFGNITGLRSALQAACASTQGVMVFDYSHRFEEFHQTLAQAFSQRKKSPIPEAKLLEQIRKRRADLDAKGVPEPPVWIREGTPGAGF